MKAIEEMNKDELYAYGVTLGVTIDRRRGLNDLREQVKMVAERHKPEVKAVEVKVNHIKKFRHKITGNIMPYNPVYADNPDLEPYYGE